jgi:hypothetical protein
MLNNKCRKFLTMLPVILLKVFILSAQTLKDEVVIDETGIKEEILNVIEIDKVWSGHPVGFSLLTHLNRQYIAFYNADRHLVVGQRNLQDKNFSLFVLPPTYRETSGGTSTVLGWDSHNYVTMDIDKKGYIHLAGNMHVHPLTYFISTKPEDIFTLRQEMVMVGKDEKRCTYPRFMKNREGELLFHYRDGASGSGNEIYNIYSCETGKWSRLIDSPLTDGQGLMNAYQSQPTIMADNWYHVWWVWRDTPDCSTNHDLSYMKSPDLKHWYNVDNELFELPATLDNRALIVDPIPVNGGIINLAAKLCLDKYLKPLFAYHKYDTLGNLQFYVARRIDKKWVSKQVTKWNYRWEFSGGGSIVFEVQLKNFIRRDDGNYELSYFHVKYGSGTILINEKLEAIGVVKKPASFVSELKPEGKFPGLLPLTTTDSGSPEEENVRYVLKWETLPSNRDRAYPEPWPEPSTLYLYKIGSRRK